MGSTALPNRHIILGACAILAVATVVRICGAWNDLWLDEIWSLNLVSGISSPLEVFTRIHHDNNHYLNSLCLYFLGPRGNWPGYRIPSLLAGVGTVVLAGLIGRRRNPASAFFAMLLTGFSYVMVLYSSEARGYAAVVFFSFLSYYWMETYLETRQWRTALLFSLSSILGFLSHLTFVDFFCAAIAWSGYRLIKSRLGLRQTLTAMLACHGLPAAFLALLYFVDVRHMVIGGGTKTSLLSGYENSLAWSVGILPAPSMILPACLIAAVLLVSGIVMLWRQNPELSVFFTGVIVMVPILLAILRHAELLYVRYFIVGIGFFLLLFGFVLASLYNQGRRGRAVCFVLLAGYFIVNGWNITSLFTYGRGHYNEATRFLVNHSKEPVVTIGGDRDLRIVYVLNFYAGDAFGNRAGKYYERNFWPQGGPEWVICHKESVEAPDPLGTQIIDDAGNRYEWVKTFPSAPLSGMHWFIYHKLAK